MKNTFWLFVLCTLCGLFFQNCKDKCDGNVSVNAVQPNTNPVGYEVLLKTSGFSNPATAKVVFGTVEASTRAGGAAGEIIAKVPAGLSGSVEISVEEGECIARSGGFVVGGLPGNVQPSLESIIVAVPLPSGSMPTGNIENNWVNAADSSGFTYGIHLVGNLVGGITSLEGAYEFYNGNSLFNNNDVTGTVNTNTNVIYLEVDRTSKAGGTVEKFDGQFIVVPSFLPSNAKYAILLVSRQTGRQLLIYYA